MPTQLSAAQPWPSADSGVRFVNFQALSGWAEAASAWAIHSTHLRLKISTRASRVMAGRLTESLLRGEPRKRISAVAELLPSVSRKWQIVNTHCPAWPWLNLVVHGAPRLEQAWHQDR